MTTEDQRPTWEVLLAGVGGQLQDLNGGLAGIAQALKDQAEAQQGSRDEAARQTRQVQRLVRVVIGGLLVVCLIGIGTFWIGIGNRHLSQQNQDLGRQNQQIGQQISSCTDPAGECARRGQAAQTAAIVTIIRCVLTLPRHATDAQITGCVLGAQR